MPSVSSVRRAGVLQEPGRDRKLAGGLVRTPCPLGVHKQTSPSRLRRYPSCPGCVASPRTAEDPAPVIFSERHWNGEGPATLRSCTLPTTRPTLYAEWTDIELVRELSPGRAEVPVSYWQRRCRRQALHFNRPTVFLAGAFLHSQSHGRASQHDRIIFTVTREKRHEDSLFSDIGDASGLRTRCSRS